MKIRTTIVCLPVRDLDRTLDFYQDALGFSDARADDGVILIELPNLSLFLMEKDAFENYTRKAGLKTQFPHNGAGMVISCAMESKDEVDIILEKAPQHGGTVSANAGIDAESGGYIGYFADPDGHLWEIAHNPKPWLAR